MEDTETENVCCQEEKGSNIFDIMIKSPEKANETSDVTVVDHKNELTCLEKDDLPPKTSLANFHEQEQVPNDENMPVVTSEIGDSCSDLPSIVIPNELKNDPNISPETSKRRRVHHDYRRLSSSGYLDDYETRSGEKEIRFSAGKSESELSLSPTPPKVKPIKIRLPKGEQGLNGNSAASGDIAAGKFVKLTKNAEY